MKQLLIISIILLLNSCGFDSQNKDTGIDELSAPKMDLYTQFDFKPNGEIIYQLYHEYGFTDKVWHLITIVKPDSKLEFEHKLPLDSNILWNNVDRIHIDKFVEGYPIQITNDYQMNSDVTISAEEYHNKEYKLNVNHNLGTYSVQKTGNIYLLRIYDPKNDLEYIELKKI
jgi:hypothetical protein